MYTRTVPLKSIAKFLALYDISAERGFLGAHDPVIATYRSFPEAASWIALGDRLPEELLCENFFSAAEKLPVFKGTLAGVSRPVLWRLAVTMGFLVQAYVWGRNIRPSQATIPAGLAVLFAKVCAKLGVDPAFNYTMYAARNWRRIDADGPISTDNVTMLQCFNGDDFPERRRAEDWFVAIHVEIERRAGPLLVAMIAAEEARKFGDRTQVTAQLLRIENILYAMRNVIVRMRERCPSQIYYDHVRPYLSGFINVAEGVIFAGVRSLKGVPQVSRGQTGAQSSIVPAVDRFLSIAHDVEDPKAQVLSVHLREMLARHTPPAHRKFVMLFDSKKRFASEHDTWESWEKRDEEVRARIIATRLALAEFRKAHYTLAVTHIVIPAMRAGDHAPRGTGGTDLARSLPKHLEETLHLSHRAEKMREFSAEFSALLRNR